jgi:predicted porin
MLKPFVTFVLLGGSAALASAQSGITTYGVIDAGVVGQRGCTGPCTTKIGSGLASESHIGIQGSEPVSQTTAAIFALETGLRVDTGRADQGERLFGRQAWVGLAGEFGALTIGRQYSLPYLALTDVADPFKGGMAGSASNLIGGPPCRP